MADAKVLITLRGGQTQAGWPLYLPGETVQGTVQVTVDTDVSCRSMTANLQWRTEGKGNTDRHVVEQRDLFQGTLSAGMPVYYDFSFTLPYYPWSYTGHYVTIVWQILVKIDVPWAKDVEGFQPFILRPDTIPEPEF